MAGEGTSESDDEADFAVSRVVRAAPERVWQAHTMPEHLQRWWAPKGFTLTVYRLDLRPGGLFHYGLRSPLGFEMFGKFVYRTVTPPDRLEFVASFADAKAESAPHPMSPGWPRDVLTTLRFEADGPSTLIGMTGHPLDASAGARGLYRMGHPVMRQGFNATLDQLDAYLAAL